MTQGGSALTGSIGPRWRWCSRPRPGLEQIALIVAGGVHRTTGTRREVGQEVADAVGGRLTSARGGAGAGRCRLTGPLRSSVSGRCGLDRLGGVLGKSDGRLLMTRRVAGEAGGRLPMAQRVA